MDSKRGQTMNSDELLSGAAPEFGGFLEKLDEYGAGSCFGCGGVVSTYKEPATGRILDLCMTCGEVGPCALLGHRFTVENCAAYRPDVMSALEWFGDRPLWNSSGWLRTIAN